ncbi:pitrilysin family protein [Pseudohongiella acticola]|jgi:predicted Zn-dependent peptidase|uniref:M16 family metallopeptidase n=1 Tax=Pseudohongiella acticola TaxID=1524254 RepID=UPI0030EF9173
MKTFSIRSALALTALTMSSWLSAQDVDAIAERVTEFTLDNGLHFIIIERPVAPVATFVTFVNVGGVDEPVNNTGVAHIFEHMAFKGSRNIGTRDWEAEQAALDKMDAAYQAWLEESYSTDPDESRLETLRQDFEQWQQEAGTFINSEEFSQLIEREGGVGLNAFTSADATGYFYSLPQNKAELWFYLEAERFREPVFREFYVEKDVIMEERRMRTDSNPQGRLLEEFLSVAYSAHPYRNPVVGWASDIAATTIADTQAFFETYYVPSNMTVAIAGDVDPQEMRALAETYLGRLPAAGHPPTVKTIEPPQRGERRFVIEEQSQPLFIAGYKTVAADHPDAAALEMLSTILSSGRTSRLYRRMVQDEQLALGVQALTGFPGSRYPSLFVTFAVPNAGVPLSDIERVLEEEIDKAKAGEIEQQELDRAVTNARAGVVRGLDSNMGLALNMAQAHAQRGSWQDAFTYLDDLEAVTLDDLQRVAQTYLVKQSRTVGSIQNAASASGSDRASDGGAGQ